VLQNRYEEFAIVYSLLPNSIEKRPVPFHQSIQLYAICAGLLFVSRPCLGQESPPATTSNVPSQQVVETDSEKQERVSAERFLELLKKRPRAGTALDKVYGYHIQNGSLDKFCESLRTEATEKSSGEAWMLLGMVLMQRGQDAEARVALEKAEELLPNEPLASYYLGKTLVLLGDVDKAAAALERSIERKPTKADMLLVFQELGRLYQRMRRGDDALAVWNRMEKYFPGDAQVQEQIAVVLAEEGASAEALSRFEALAKTTKDRFRKVEMTMRAAQLKETLGKREEALADFEKLLTQVNPDSWIHTDLRTRIDNVFLTRNDYDGLANYYTKWMEKNPDDIDAMLRIGRLLSVQRRSPEAKAWFSKAIERAPSNPEPRLALIDALERDRECGPAAEAMQALAEIQPDNPDTIVRWGELIFSNQSLPEAKRANDAAEVWSKLLTKRGEDPVTVARVADLLRGVNKTDEAIAAYRKAISLAENEPQYREYLGEYLFRLNRKDEALSVWRELASGPRENRGNLVRLSEVLSTFQLREEALATMSRVFSDEANLGKPTFGQRTRFAEMLRDASKYDQSLQQLELAASIAETPEEQSLLIDEQIKNFQANGQLADRIGELEKATAGSDRENSKTWEKLALYQEADRKFQQAAASIARAAELDAKSVNVQTIAVRVQEKAGMFGDAISTLRKLSALDRRYLSNYLTQIASLQMRLGQVEAALATGQELVSASSANSEQFKFFADLCFQAGKTDQGLGALRRNVRSNPNDREAMRYLARSLSNQFQTEEAVELYWRAFMTSPTIEEKRADVELMTELYLRTNRFEQLVTRLDTIGREENRQREATLLVAAANQAAGDLGAARALLEPLLREESRDADLLTTLVKLAQAEFDWEAATAFQKRLNEVSPSPEGEYQLSRFLLEQGDIAQAQAIWAKMASNIATTESVSQTIEKLLTRGESDKAIELAEQSLVREPENWELMSVVMTALWRADKRDRATEVADRLLKMSVPFETKSLAAKKQQSQAARANSNTTAPASLAASAARQGANVSLRSSWLSRLSQNSRAFGQINTDPFGAVYYSSSTRSNPTTIYCFGDAQAMAMALKQALAIAKNPEARKSDEEIANEVIKSEKVEEIWNAIARIQINSSVALTPSLTATADPAKKAPRSMLLERLAEIGDLEAPAQLLQAQYATRQRTAVPNLPLNLPTSASTLRTGAANSEPLPALSEGELLKLERLYEQTVHNQNSQTNSPTTMTPYALWLSDEFRLAKDDAKTKMYFESAKELAERSTTNAFGPFLSRDREFALKLFHSFLDRQLQTQRAGNSATSYFQTASFVNQLIAEPKDTTEITKVLQVLKKSQAAYARQQRPSQLVSYNPSQTINTNISSNGQVVRLQVDFPAASALLSNDLLVSLRLIQQSTNKELKAAVGKTLAEDAQTADEEVMQSAVDRLCFGTWLWWEDARAAALEQMQEYRKLNVAPELGLVIESRMLFETKQIDAALALLESLKPMNQQMLQDRELAILQLVLQKGDIDRAKQSAERLFALRLDSATQMQVGELMMQLGMREMAESVLQRVRQRSGNDLSSQHSLMQKLQTLDNKSGAVEIARQILRRTQPGANTNVRTAEDSYRRSAIQVLVGSGEAKAMIASLEARLEKSPNATALIRQLSELYEATGKRNEAQALLARMTKSGGNDAQSLLAMARSLQQSGKHAEAVEAYLKAFEKLPDLLNNEYYNLRKSAEAAKKWKDVAAGIERIGIKRFRQTYRITELMSELTRSSEIDAAKKLLKAWIRDSGIAAIMQMASFANDGATQSLFDDEIASLTVDRFLAGLKIDAAATSLFQTRSNTANGRCISLLSLFDDLLEKRETEYQRLLSAVRALSDKQSSMRIVEAALVASRDESASLDELLPKIIEEARQPSSSGLQGIWPLASVLAHDHKMYQRAIDLIEPVSDRLADLRSGYVIDYTADGLLIYCYMQLKQNEKAKAIIDKSVAAPSIDTRIATSNPGYGEYQFLQMQIAAAQKYVAMKYPLDALRLAIRVKDDKALWEKARLWSNNDDYYQQQLKSIESQARQQITPEMLEAVFAREFALPTSDHEQSKKEGSLQSVLIELSFKESKGKSSIDCLLKQLLDALPKKATSSEMLKRILADAMAVPLTQRTLGQLVMLSCLTIRIDDQESFLRIVNEMLAREEILSKEPVTITPQANKDGTELSQKEKAAAAMSALNSERLERCGIWIAVEYAAQTKHSEQAERLAKLAMHGFEPQSIEGQKMKLQFATLQVEVGKKTDAENTLRDLLDELIPPKK
jgi:tetratricopeptide (TPR) repeat protein